jgi:hypothetical protein
LAMSSLDGSPYLLSLRWSQPRTLHLLLSRLSQLRILHLHQSN